MDINKNLGDLMKEAQKMQQRMQDAQKELSAISITGEAGTAKLIVKVKMTGRHDVTSVEIAPDLMDEDVEVLEGLVAAAVNAAVRNVEKVSQEKIKSLTQGLNIPTDLLNKEDDE